MESNIVKEGSVIATRSNSASTDKIFDVVKDSVSLAPMVKVASVPTSKVGRPLKSETIGTFGGRSGVVNSVFDAIKSTLVAHSMVKTASEEKPAEEKDEKGFPEKMTEKDAEQLGFFKQAKACGWGIYQISDIDGGLGSIWYLEAGEDGGQYLVKQVDVGGDIVRRTLASVKTASVKVSVGQSLTPVQIAQFLDLTGQLSPENLACDGEIPMSQVKKRYAQIMRQWRELEKQVGRSVSQDEIYEINIQQGSNPAKTASSEEAQDFISKEIKHLKEDKGYEQDRAVGAAHEIAREKGYEVPKKKAAFEGHGANEGWDVFLDGKKIDTVFYVPGMSAEEVKRGLVNHDNFDPGIVVRRERKIKKSDLDLMLKKIEAVKRKVEIDDDLDERVKLMKDEVRDSFKDYLEENPDMRDFDEFYQKRGADQVSEAADSNTPIYYSDIDGLYYLYGDEFEEAYKNAGVGDGTEQNHKQAAIYYYLSDKGHEALRELENLFDENEQDVAKTLAAIGGASQTPEAPQASPAPEAPATPSPEVKEEGQTEQI